MNRATSVRILRSLTYTNPSSWSAQRAFSPRALPVSFGPSSCRVTQHLASVPRRPNSSIATPRTDGNRERTVSKLSPEGYTDEYVRLQTSPNAGSRTSSFGTFWLRDSCQCSKCIHPDTRQRAGDTFSIPRNVHVISSEYNAEGAMVKWSDGHDGIYPYGFLATHANQTRTTRPQKGPKHIRFRPFKSHDPASKDYPTVSYSDVMSSNSGLLQWLENIYDWGFCFVKGVPVDPESTKNLIERIAFIRHTHYGGFWDFTADLTFKDTAYTTEFLGAHTDSTYFTDPARLQLFHLLSHTDGQGGASLLVDGFKAASLMRDENARNLETLMTETQPYHASGNDDVCIQPATMEPVVKNHRELNRIYQIRWNNYDRAAKRAWTLDQQNKWYSAADHWNTIVQQKDMEIWTQLEPGTALIFDNWRMMHGRSEYTGKRRMCGGYVNNDDFVSQYRLQKFGRENVLENLGNTFPGKENPFYYI